MSAPGLRFALAAPAVAAVLACGCSSADWPAFRHDALRTASQLAVSPLSDPDKVENHLEIKWRSEKLGRFIASPVVYKKKVFIGDGDGYFYALSVRNGQVLWKFPSAVTCPGCKPLTSKFTCNVSSFGIASSATIAKVHGVDAVIFAAPDPCVGTGLGEGRLFALDIRTGKPIWKSEVIARLNGCTTDCPAELHENVGHSSPLVLGDKVYVGISDHCDSPVQQGRVAAVQLATGRIAAGFSYCSTGTCGDGTRGGGVWSPLAGLEDSLYVTTGNTRIGRELEPRPNRGLSLLRLNAATGKVAWQFKPMLFEVDNDSDWSAAPTVMSTSCGLVIVSTQKDGWTHAVNAVDGTRRWSFPQRCLPFSCGDGTRHDDTKYMRSGAAWGNVYVTMNGGLDLPFSIKDSYRRLHAFNVCEPEENRLRWLIDLKKYTSDDCIDFERCLGNPTITHGIVYIGTDAGYLLAIGDPAVVSDDGLRCMNPDVASKDCTSMGFRLVRQPKVLANVLLKGSMAYTEPALAHGEIYVSTDALNDGGGGYVYMLQPKER